MGYGLWWGESPVSVYKIAYTQVRDDGYWQEYHCGKYYALASAYKRGAWSGTSFDRYEGGVIWNINRAVVRLL